MNDIFGIALWLVLFVVGFGAAAVMALPRLVKLWTERGPWVVALMEGGVEVYFTLYMPTTPKHAVWSQVAGWTTFIHDAFSFAKETEPAAILRASPACYLRPLAEVKREQLDFLERMARDRNGGGL